MHQQSRVADNTLVSDSTDASFELRARYLWMEHTSIISFIISCIDIWWKIHLNGELEKCKLYLTEK